MRPDVIKETAISICEAKDILDAVKERDGELSYRAAKTMEYLQEFTAVSGKKAKEIAKKIDDLGVPRVKEQQINKLLDVWPKNGEDVKLVLQAFMITLKEDQVKKILNIFEESSPKAKAQESAAQ